MNRLPSRSRRTGWAARSSWVAFAFICCGCGPTALAPEHGAVRGAIVGGNFDPADPQVFELWIVGNNAAASTCTATLIDMRTLLTAAHCVDPRTIGATSITVSAMNLSSDASAGPADYIKVTEMRTHPQWNLNTLDNDIGVALLETSPAGVTPKSWNSQSVAGMSGLPLRAVGYGTTGPAGVGAGVRREVPLIFRQVTAEKIFLGDQSSKGICHGDSGGPSFHVFPDGTERVVGVHSYTVDQTCLDGADTRVDVQSSFIQQWISEKEAPTCGEDGRCKLGCTPMDIDCVCGPDGMCTTQCPNLLKDPDCPKDCAPNGVCSVKACPIPDVDCAAIGGACTGSLQCVSRSCVSDPQHTPYCSQGCTVTSDCPAKMECGGTQTCHFKQLPLVALELGCDPDRESCGPGAICTGRLATATRCAKSCFDGRDCDPDLICETSYDGQKFCTSKPQVILELAKAEGPAAPGCQAAPMGLVAWLSLAGWRPRRASRRQKR